MRVNSPRRRSMRPDRTRMVIEGLRRQRENRRQNAEVYRKRRAEEIRKNERIGKPGDIDFQRMISDYRQDLSPPLAHTSIGPLKINIVVRKRPISQDEVDRKDHDSISCNNPVVHVHHCKLRVDGITKYLETTKFFVDHAFGETASNQEVYENTVRPLIDFALTGGRATCFAYGQTGSGKTYTMAGVQAIAAKEIFQKMKSKQNSNFSVNVAFFELYGGQCVDLLSERSICMIREDGKGRVHVEGLNEIIVECQEELLEIIAQGNLDRTTHATEMNSVSSRSHAICQITFRKRNSYKKEPFGKLSLIDLAGSERGQDTKCHNKQRRKESAEINKSLLALKECIRALDNSGRHVPYRVSKLTMVLKDSFSKDAKTVMISCVSPAASSTDHTLNTLRYADRVKEKKKNRIRPQTTKLKMRNKRRQTISSHSFGFKASLSTNSTVRDNDSQSKPREDIGLGIADIKSSRSGLRNVTTSRGGGRKAELKLRSSTNSDPVTFNDRETEENGDLLADIEEAIQRFEENENESSLGNKSEPIQNTPVKASRSINDCIKLKKRRYEEESKPMLQESKSEWGDIVSLTSHSNSMEIEDNFSKMSFKELVVKLVDEEEDLLNSHMISIERNATLLREESKLLEKVKENNTVDYDIDVYTDNLELIVRERLDMYSKLFEKLKLFKSHLSMEGVRT